MIKSMTGYGKAELETGSKKIILELKSLNSKQIDINTRTAALYREKELEIRKEISEKLIRGKIDFSLYLEDLGTECSSVVNENVVKTYFNQFSKMQKELGLPVSEKIMQLVMKLPDTVRNINTVLDDQEWEQIFHHIQVVIAKVDEFRIQEGKALENDIRHNISDIQSLLTQITPFENQRIQALKVRITESLAEIDHNGAFDKNRFEQEMIYYLEKLDINEEKVRLINHCDYFIQTLDNGGPVGKILSFIAQEIGREINTIGSKANESNIQRIVVQMKDSLEKIKEQILNVL